MKKHLFLYSILIVLNIFGSRRLSNPNYGTHMAALVTAVVSTNGPVFELGCGDYSTPLLHAICAIGQRRLLSTETDQKWLNLFGYLERPWHEFIYVPVYEDDWAKNPKPYLWDAIGDDVHWGVVFVDHRPGDRRRIDILRFKDSADIIVVHDTDELSYGYESVFSQFKYRYDYVVYKPHTTLVSNTIDVVALFEK